MRRVTSNDMLPRPIQILGLLTDEMKNRLAEVRREVGVGDTNLANILAIPPEVWEAGSVEEVGRNAHLEECEIQVLRDKAHNRYYFCAMSVDPERTRAEVVDGSVEEVDGIRAPMVLYYCEITRAEFRRWQREDMKKNKETNVQVE